MEKKREREKHGVRSKVSDYKHKTSIRRVSGAVVHMPPEVQKVFARVHCHGEVY